MTKSVLLLMISGCFVALSATAQQERKFIREGNELFQKMDLEKAEVEYRKAADQNSDSFEAAFNMADALYKQEKYDEALAQFSRLAQQETDKERLGAIYHNIGNTLLSMEKTQESIEAYKESLRNRPSSVPTKYNLEYARSKQQQEQQNQQNQDKNQDQQNKDKQDQNKDQNKNNQDQNKDQNQDQNKDQQNQNNQDKNKQDQNKDQQNKQNPDDKRQQQ
ncbi:MAG: tetratricopeptide repeat protein, partial [Odoribacter sp.]|nr:tetratricopeptide repeat protein [Odoribacter sp.]